MTEPDILSPFVETHGVTVYQGDCIETMRRLPENSVDAIVTDPPYGLEFMGKGWDSFRVDDPGTNRNRGDRAGSHGELVDVKDRADRRSPVAYGGGKRPSTFRCTGCGKRDQFRNDHDCAASARWARELIDPYAAPPTMLAFAEWTRTWALEAYRVLKPGGHLLAFAGTRTYHRMASGVEDAGFEIRDCIAWMYGSGFPKSLDVSKAIDKHGGSKIAWFGPWFRQWREANGITQKEVAALFPSKTGGLTGCVANWELGFNMPTPEQFNAIRDKFGLPFDSIKEAEREVIGKHSGDMGGLGGERLGAGAGDITAPATPDAVKWSGWGTALKPAFEPIVVARKPLIGTVAQNVLEHGTGALNIDACRISTDGEQPQAPQSDPHKRGKAAGEYAISTRDTERMHAAQAASIEKTNTLGRWPANVVLDETAGAILDEQSGIAPPKDQRTAVKGGNKRALGAFAGSSPDAIGTWPADPGGGASRFFYCAKASKKDRNTNGAANTHPTVKPTELMRWLIRLVTPPGGIILDPFGGSGSTGVAAQAESVRCILIEREAEYLAIIRERLDDGSLFSQLP